MTAREFIKKWFPLTKHTQYAKTDIDFAKDLHELLKEQRKLCAKQASLSSRLPIYSSVLNTPEP